MFEATPPQAQAATSERVAQLHDCAQRVLKEIFNLDVECVEISEDTTFFDFAGEGSQDPHYSLVWAECLKQEMFGRYGISCEAHEPVLDVLARLQCAERGVRVAVLD
jgi:ADP-ribose pyrophosphatase YjhB (NUDIX family)